MSLKIHYLNHHLYYFSRQLATESHKQGKRYHQVAMPSEIGYLGRKTLDAVLAEICWWRKNVFEDNEEEEGGGKGVQRETEIMANSVSDYDSDDFPLQPELKIADVVRE